MRNNSAAWLWVLVSVIAFTLALNLIPHRKSQGEVDDGALKSDRPPALSVPPFSLEDAAGRALILRSRKLQIDTCNSILEDYADRKNLDSHLACHAAKMLGKLHAGDSDAPRLLVRNILLESIDRGEPGPLDGLVAAQALVRIGGKNVIEELLNGLENSLSRRELLIYVNVFHDLEGQEFAVVRIQFELDKLAKKKVLSEELQQKKRNLSQLKTWLCDPDFLKKAENDPSQ